MGTVGRFELLERVGEGGSAQVYRARAIDDGREVAVKLLGGGASEADLARFERECRAVEGLDHPHLIRVIEHGVDAERGPWLAMPLVRGMTLRDLCAGRRLCPEAALVLLLPMVEALAALHAEGLVHRDVKPENLMLGLTGDVTLVDLGLALREQDTRHTKEGEVAGSVPYLSQERIEGRRVDPSADVWAVGVMLYELIAGARPFARRRSGEEVAAILAGRFTPLREVDRRVGAELDRLVDDCLAPEPGARPADAGALLERMRPLCPVPPDALREARVAVLSDPDGYDRRVAPRLVEELASRAEGALAAGDGFGALRLLDRALAYAPDDARTLELVERASTSEEAFAGPVRTASATEPGAKRDAASRSEPAPPSRRRPIQRLALALGGVSLLAAIGVTTWAVVGPFEEPADPRAAGVTPAVPSADAGAGPDGGVVAALVPLRPETLSNADPPELDGVARSADEPLVPVSWLSSDEPAEALARAEARLAEDPDDVAARVDRAMALLTLEREREGLAELSELERAHGQHPALESALGYVRMRQGRFEEAEALFSRALEDDPGDTETRRMRGVLRRRRGRTRDAYLDLWRVLEERPRSLLALAEMTQIYERARDPAAAIPVFRRLLRLAPTSAEAWVGLSIALGQSAAEADRDEAVEAVEHAIELDPDEARYLDHRCLLLSRLERPGVMAACAAAIEVSPRQPDLYMARARELSRRGEHARALADADRAVELAPDVPYQHFNRHLIRGRAGEVEAAIRDLTHACELGHAPACARLRQHGRIP